MNECKHEFRYVGRTAFGTDLYRCIGCGEENVMRISSEKSILLSNPFRDVVSGIYNISQPFMENILEPKYNHVVDIPIMFRGV